MSLSFTNLQNLWPSSSLSKFDVTILYLLKKNYFAIYVGVLAIYTYYNASKKVKTQKTLKACKINHKMLNCKARKYGQVPLILDDQQKIMTQQISNFVILFV